MDVLLSAEKIASIGKFPITNTLLATWVVMAILILSSYFSTRRLKVLPGKWQNFIEGFIEFLYDNVSSLAQGKAKIFFPLVATFFIFIISSNWIGLLPGFGTIGFWQVHDGTKTFVPLLRSANSDLNTTFAFALISVFATHIFALRLVGFKTWISRYLSLNPIYLFVGALEIISEITKIISLSFRLFGNIFAGEALIARISTLAAFVLPVPFLLMEVLVGFIQATIFGILTLAFMVILSNKEH